MTNANTKNFYITTAIAYPNGAPHLGHAYEVILTDVMARTKRLDGFNVHFLTGTDEHGQKVAKTAEKEGIEPIAFTNKIAALFQAMDKNFNISHDDFIRTTEPRHYKASQAIWSAIQTNGQNDIYLGKYEGWYSIRDEAFFGESELTTAPDGSKLAPSGAPVEWVVEPSYFFRLSAYTEKLLKHYEENPHFIQPETRRNEIISFVKGGLQDLSISRTNFKWGVPVPGDENHVMYVWLDALTNYITGVGYPDVGSESFKTFWPVDFHVIGKDIIRFHCVYWPAFLMAANIPLPKAVFAHGFINVDGQKMSKSVGNVVAPQDLIETYGVDQTRYLLMREVPHGQDGNFSHDQAVLRINAELANGLGNLAQRSLSMIAKNFDGVLPTPIDLTAEDTALLELARAKTLPLVLQHTETFEFHRVLQAIAALVAEGNVYIDREAPWKHKENKPRQGTILYCVAETLRCLGIMLQPYMPESTAKMLDLLAVGADKRQFAHLGSVPLAGGQALPAPQALFPRIENAKPV